jgi:hypothetical protein
MSKLSARGAHYFEQLRQAQFQGGTTSIYAEADAMLEAVMAWADFNFDDWLYIEPRPEEIGDVQFAQMRNLLQQRQVRMQEWQHLLEQRQSA